MSLLRNCREIPFRDPLSAILLAFGLGLAVVASPRAAVLPVALSCLTAWLLARYRNVTALRLFALALIVRLGLAIALAITGGGGVPAGADIPLPERLYTGGVFPDEPYFAASAETLLRGPDVTGIAHRRFAINGISYLFAPFVAAGGRSLASTRYASSLAGALGIVALYFAGGFIVGVRAARRAAALVAVLPGVALFSAAGLKEGFVLAFAATSLGAALYFATRNSNQRSASSDTEPGRAPSSRDPLWRSVAVISVFWLSLAALISLRENLGFAVGLIVPILGFLAASRSRIKRALALALASLTCFWALGFGVMGVGVVDFLNPAYLNQRYEIEQTDSRDAAPAGPEGASVADANGSPGSRFGSLIKRIPGGMWTVIVRPYPFEASKGSLGEYASHSRLVTGADQLIWYVLLAGAVLGWVRSLRRWPSRTVPFLILLVSIVTMYAATLAVMGTAYRLRLALVPFVALGVFIPRRSHSDPASRSVNFVVPTLGPGGTEAHVLRTAAGAAGAGWQTHVTVLRNGSGGDPGAAPEVKVVGAGRKRRLDPTLPWRIARRSGNAVLFSTYLFAGNFWGGIAARIKGAALATNIRTTHPRGLIQRLLEPLTEGDSVIVNSEAVARAAARRGLNPRKMIVVHNGVDIEALQERVAAGPGRSEIRRGFGLSDDDWVVLVPGRIDPLKNQLQAVRAFESAGIEGSVLCLAGPATLDAEKRYLEEVRRESDHLGGRVRFLGMVDDLPSLIASADLVLLTSEHEGMPNAVLEAMALGTPVVATGAGGVAELLLPGEDESCGILATSGELAGAIARVASEPDAARSRAGRARERVREYFSLERERAACIEAFELTIERRAEAGRPIGLAKRDVSA